MTWLWDRARLRHDLAVGQGATQRHELSCRRSGITWLPERFRLPLLLGPGVPRRCTCWNLVVTMSRVSPTTGYINALPRGRSYDGLQASLPR